MLESFVCYGLPLAVPKFPLEVPGMTEKLAVPRLAFLSWWLLPVSSGLLRSYNTVLNTYYT
jgi:hypothetical protein